MKYLLAIKEIIGLFKSLVSFVKSAILGYKNKKAKKVTDKLNVNNKDKAQTAKELNDLFK